MRSWACDFSQTSEKAPSGPRLTKSSVTSGNKLSALITASNTHAVGSLYPCQQARLVRLPNVAIGIMGIGDGHPEHHCNQRAPSPTDTSWLCPPPRKSWKVSPRSRQTLQFFQSSKDAPNHFFHLESLLRVRSPNLANKNIRHLVKFEFQISNKLCFSENIFQSTYLHLKTLLFIRNSNCIFTGHPLTLSNDPTINLFLVSEFCLKKPS